MCIEICVLNIYSKNFTKQINIELFRRLADFRFDNQAFYQTYLENIIPTPFAQDAKGRVLAGLFRRKQEQNFQNMEILL